MSTILPRSLIHASGLPACLIQAVTSNNISKVFRGSSCRYITTLRAWDRSRTTNPSSGSSSQQHPPCQCRSQAQHVRFCSSSTEKNDNIPEHTSDQGQSFTIPGTQTGGRKMGIIFTCTVCETRSAKQFTERAYTHGVVLVRCSGCQNLHLIADRLGYFDDGDFDLETIAKKMGHDVRRVTDVAEVDLETLIGKDRMKELLENAEQVHSEK